MILQCLELGYMYTNTYIYGPDEKNVAIIDPGFDADTIIDVMTNLGAKPAVIILTHGHSDHTGMAKTLQNYYEDVNPPIACCKEMEDTYTSSKPIRYVVEGDVIHVGSIELEVLEAPGHSPDSILLVDHANQLAFVGDVIFRGGVGRVFEGSGEVLMESIREKIMYNPRLGGNFKLYPGHGVPTDIETERTTNPFRTYWT